MRGDWWLFGGKSEGGGILGQKVSCELFGLMGISRVGSLVLHS